MPIFLLVMLQETIIVSRKHKTLHQAMHLIEFLIQIQ